MAIGTIKNIHTIALIIIELISISILVVIYWFTPAGKNRGDRQIPCREGCCQFDVVLLQDELEVEVERIDKLLSL